MTAATVPDLLHQIRVVQAQATEIGTGMEMPNLTPDELTGAVGRLLGNVQYLLSMADSYAAAESVESAS
jgi:hypothetical protein